MSSMHRIKYHYIIIIVLSTFIEVTSINQLAIIGVVAEWLSRKTRNLVPSGA